MWNVDNIIVNYNPDLPGVRNSAGNLELYMKTLEEIIAAPKPPIKNSFSHFDQKLLLQIDPHDRSLDLINIIVKKNQKLIHSEAAVLWRHCPLSAKSVLEYEDLVSAGQFGLIRAATLYDRLFNTEFATYAMFWIRQTIIREIENNFSAVRIPVHFISKMKKVRHGGECDPGAVLAAKTVEHFFLSDLSLDAYVIEGERTTLSDLLPNSASMNKPRFPGYNDPEALVLLSDLRKRIEESMTCLVKAKRADC